jgi:hypothetical protein
MGMLPRRRREDHFRRLRRLLVGGSPRPSGKWRLVLDVLVLAAAVHITYYALTAEEVFPTRVYLPCMALGGVLSVAGTRLHRKHRATADLLRLGGALAFLAGIGAFVVAAGFA